MIFVTGGTGLVGTHLLFELAQQGRQVRALKRASTGLEETRRIFGYYSKHPDDLLKRIEWVEGDLQNEYFLEDYLEGITEIYHTAALVSFDPLQRKKMLRINVEGTACLVNMAIKKNISKFCFVSSVAAVGPRTGPKPVDETSIWKKSKYTHFYAWTKFKSEMEVWRGWAEGLNTIIVNPSIILGPGNWHRGAGQMFQTINRGLAFYPPGITGYVDVRDVVAIMIRLMDNGYFGERYILNSENLRFREVFTIISMALDKKPPAFPAKRWMMSLAWRAEWCKSKLTGTPPVITRETARSGANEKTFSNEKISRLLDYTFIPVEKSIQEISRYFLKDAGAVGL